MRGRAGEQQIATMGRVGHVQEQGQRGYRNRHSSATASFAPWSLLQSCARHAVMYVHAGIPTIVLTCTQAFHQPPGNVCHIFLASTIAESSVTLPKAGIASRACCHIVLSVLSGERSPCGMPVRRWSN